MVSIVVLLLGTLFCKDAFSVKDHAPLHGHRQTSHDYVHHEAAAENFKNKNFRDTPGGPLTLNKAHLFLARLTEEYQKNISKYYETRFLEQLDVKKTSSVQAEKKSHVLPQKSNVLAPYELYLFPKMHALIEALEAQNQNLAESLLDDFIRGYIPYFNPNPYNNILTSKINIPALVKRIFVSPLKKKNTKNAQANNLILETKEQVEDISILLGEEGRDLQIGDFLTQDHLKILIDKDYDISQINPGESALWQPMEPHDQQNFYAKDPVFFPTDNAKKYFHKVMLGGSASTKVQLLFKDADGVERKVKLKVGDEVYPELASAALLKLVGYSSDMMTYAGDVKFYLGATTFDNFEAEIRFKFGQISNPRYNFERGQDENGERYIIWRDALFEARPDFEIRISPLDIASWDLQNRREYRAMELMLAWLGINDLKIDNFKALLVNKNGQWLPKHRLHDAGFSLGASLVINQPRDILNLQERKGKINELEDKIVFKKSDGVVIRWNDFYHQNRKYLSSTYYDYKWMARKIAAISVDDITQAFAHSGMHADLAHLYTIKLIIRRNNIVKSFDLQDEFPLYDAPQSLKKYSPPDFPSIKNGRIDLTAYDGKVAIPKRITTWGSMISTLLAGQNIPHADFKTTDNVAGNFSATGQVGAVAFDYNWRHTDQNFGPFSKTYLQPGITIVPSRKVVQNVQNLNTNLRNKQGISLIDDKGQKIRTNLPYVVIDELKFSVAVKCGAGISRFLPMSISGGAKFVERRVTHYHFAETIKDAWLSSFRLIKLIKQGMNQFAAQNLSDLESLDSYFSIGANFDAKLASNLIASSAGLGAGARKHYRNFFYRDQYGQLHRMRDRTNTYGANANLTLVHQDLLVCDAAAFDLGASANGVSGELTDHIVTGTQDAKLESHEHADRTKEQIEQESKNLKNIDKGKEASDHLLNFSRTYRGGNTDKHMSLFFLFTKRHSTNWGEIEDTFINGQTRKLFQHSAFSGSYIGKKLALPSLMSAVDVAIKKGKSKQTIVEAELRAPEKFIITVKNKVFARKKTKKGLDELIKKLNARYSKTSLSGQDEQFFSSLALPDADDQNEYRKIYAVVKVLVDGEYLLEKVRTVTLSDLKPMLARFFDKEVLKIKKAHWEYSDDGQAVEKSSALPALSRIANTLTSFQKKQQIIADFMSLKALLDNPEQNNEFWHKVWIKSRDLVHHLSSRYYGCHLLKAFLNINASEEDLDVGLLVYGEIQNIGDHITSLQRPYSFNANLRNAGNHWGKFHFGKDKIRPVQYFLKYEDPTDQLSVYQPLMISSANLLGFLEKGVPENYSGQGI